MSEWIEASAYCCNCGKVTNLCYLQTTTSQMLESLGPIAEKQFSRISEAFDEGWHHGTLEGYIKEIDNREMRERRDKAIEGKYAMIKEMRDQGDYYIGCKVCQMENETPWIKTKEHYLIHFLENQKRYTFDHIAEGSAWCGDCDKPVAFNFNTQFGNQFNCNHCEAQVYPDLKDKDSFMKDMMESASLKFLSTLAALGAGAGFFVAELIYPSFQEGFVYPAAIILLAGVFAMSGKILPIKIKNILGSLSGPILKTVGAYAVGIFIGGVLSWMSSRMVYNKGLQSAISIATPILFALLTASLTMPKAWKNSKKMNAYASDEGITELPSDKEDKKEEENAA